MIEDIRDGFKTLFTSIFNSAYGSDDDDDDDDETMAIDEN